MKMICKDSAFSADFHFLLSQLSGPKGGNMENVFASVDKPVSQERGDKV